MRVIHKLRQLNRKRNHLKKEMKYAISLYLAAKKWKKSEGNPHRAGKSKKILLIRNDGKIGDAIVSTCFLKSLFEAGYCVDILAVKENEELFRHNPYINKVYLAQSQAVHSVIDKYDTAIAKEVLGCLRENAYDLLIDTAIWQTALYMPKMIAEIDPKITLGFNKPGWLKSYDVNIEFDHFNNHVKNIYLSVLSYLGIEVSDALKYEIYYPESIDEEVHKANVLCHDKENLLINIYASHTDRDLSKQQLSKLLIKLSEDNDNRNIIVLDHKGLLKQADVCSAKIYQVPSLNHAMAIIKMSDYVITPDTAVVHISAAYDKKMIGVYQDSLKNNALWAPGYKNGHQVFSEEFVFKNDHHLVGKISQKLNAIANQ